MRKWKTGLCALLCVFMLLPFCACGGSSGYRIIDTYSLAGDYVIAFRQGDQMRDIVSAAMEELEDNGTLRAISFKWFGENLISTQGKAGAMGPYWDTLQPRTVTVGVDITNMPMSYQTPEGYLGFDVDLANYLCTFLGWSMVVYPIDPADVDIELGSGNIDMAMGISQSNADTGASSRLSFTPSYLTSRYVLVARVAGRIRDRAALRGKVLGVVVTDLDVLQKDEKLVNSLKAVTYQTNTAGLFQALQNGEVDGILVPSVVAAYYMK